MFQPHRKFTQLLERRSVDRAYSSQETRRKGQIILHARLRGAMLYLLVAENSDSPKGARIITIVLSSTQQRIKCTRALMRNSDQGSGSQTSSSYSTNQPIGILNCLLSLTLASMEISFMKEYPHPRGVSKARFPSSYQQTKRAPYDIIKTPEIHSQIIN